MADTGESRPDIILNSPVGSKPAVYKWPLTYVAKGQKFDGAEEIIETIRWVAKEYSEFKPAIENLLPDQPDLKSYDCIKSLCDKYNKIPDMVMKMNKGTSVALKTSSRASQGLLKHIVQQVYNYAVVDPTELNKYSPFSSETYGETSFEFMAQLIEKNQFKPKEDDTFIDMGSGVGHLVLQVAATVECKKCYGIEIADVPAGYAKIMEERFKFWMNWHGKTYTPFELIHGNFFDKKYADIIKSSTYILVNNFAFKPEVDYKLKQRFLDLNDGTQILSSKPFCSPKKKVTERDLTDIGSVMEVFEIKPELKKDSVSWTPNPLPYYLHIIDSSPIEKYYQKQKRRQCRSTSERGKPSKKRKATRGGSESASEDSDDNIVYGPTTRKAWSEWCNSGNLTASNRTSTDSAKASSAITNSSDNTEVLSESAIEEAIGKKSDTSEESVPHPREKRSDSQNSERLSISSHGSGTQSKGGQSSSQAPKSCLDKKRDYATKKNSTSSLTNAPPSALYSISKPADPTNGSSPTKIPNIVIKVKPPAQTKATGETSQPTPKRAKVSTVTPSVKQEVEVNNENGKKLRQRKKINPAPVDSKPSAPQTKRTSTSATKSDTKQSGPVTLLSSSTTNGTRARKSSVSTKSSTSRSTTSKKKAITPDKNSSLDLLHAKTIESVSGNLGFNAQPAPGCEEHSLRSITELSSLPNVIIRDPSMFRTTVLSDKNWEKSVVEPMKKDFETFITKFQQPNARESLNRLIDDERARNRELSRQHDELISTIKFLTEKTNRALKSHCDELGIKNTPRSIVLHLGAQVKQHQDLIAYVNQLEASLQPSQRTMIPPAAHSNSTQCLTSPYRVSGNTATLDLSLK